MIDLNEYLYKQSLRDIHDNLENIEFFKKLKRTYEYCNNSDIFNDVLESLKYEQKSLISYHTVRYDEVIDIMAMRRGITQRGMKLGEALVIIDRLKRMKVRLHNNELDFFDTVERKEYPYLTVKQSEWLERIANRYE